MWIPELQPGWLFSTVSLTLLTALSRALLTSLLTAALLDGVGPWPRVSVLWCADVTGAVLLAVGHGRVGY